MPRSWMWVAVSSLMVFALGGLLAARGQNANPANSYQNVQAVTLMRIINTAEYSYRRDHARFGAWEELYNSGVVSDVQKYSRQWGDISISAGPEVISNHRLGLLVSPDGTSYSLSLHDTQSENCGLSLFSDESGLIYQGSALDCPRIVDAPSNALPLRKP
jgi:hypothetical protein